MGEAPRTGLYKTHINDTARRIATVSDKLNRQIKNYLPTRRRKPPMKDGTHTGLLQSLSSLDSPSCTPLRAKRNGRQPHGVVAARLQVPRLLLLYEPKGAIPPRAFQPQEVRASRQIRSGYIHSGLPL